MFQRFFQLLKEFMKFKGLRRICERIFASPKGKTLSSKRVFGAILIASGITKGFIVLIIWAFLKDSVPSEIITIIVTEIGTGAGLLTSTVLEPKFKKLKDK